MSKSQSTSIVAVCHCGKRPPIEGRSRCAECIARATSLQKQLRGERVAAGVCPCGSSPVDGKKACERCLARHRRAGATQRSKRKARGGVCRWCPRPVTPGYGSCERCRRGQLERAKRYNQSDREIVFARYGGRCECCGETTEKFLTLDHIDGDGTKHRRAIKRPGTGFYRWVRLNGFPDILRLLCWNCNCGRRMNGGICPHQQKHPAVAG